MLVSQPPRNSRSRDETKFEQPKDEIIQYHILTINTQEQSLGTTTFVEPIHCAFELTMFEALLGCGQEISFAHLEFEFA